MGTPGDHGSVAGLVTRPSTVLAAWETCRMLEVLMMVTHNFEPWSTPYTNTLYSLFGNARVSSDAD